MADTLLQSEPIQPVPTPTPRTQPRVRIRTLLLGTWFAFSAVFIAEVLRIFVGSNFHSVVPGKCYRSAQPGADFLASVQREYGIRTIINLRGGDENDNEPWYREEKEAAARLGLHMVKTGLSSKEQAPDDDFRKFVEGMRDAQEPILIHCANGNDRSGLASAVYLMMRTDTPVSEARKQLSLRYGHIPWTRASCLSRILDSYEAWLADNGWEHTPDRFYHWGTRLYRAELP